MKLEIHFKDNAKARKLLAKAMNRFPSSEKIRLLAISIDDRSERGAKLAEAMEACGDSSLLALAAAKNFASRGNVKKSRKWFGNAIMQSDYGEPVLIEAWACYYKFEKMWGTEKSTNEVLLRLLKKDYFPEDYTDFKEFQDQIDTWTLTAEEIPEAFADKTDMGDFLR